MDTVFSIHKIHCSLICVTYFSPVWGKLYIVIQVIYVPPAVDINSSSCCDDQHHQSQFNQVADLYQHGRSDEGHDSHEAVVLWILCAASVTERLQHGTRRAVEDSKGRWNAAQLQHRRWSARVTFSKQLLCSSVLIARKWLIQITAFNWTGKLEFTVN